MRAVTVQRQSHPTVIEVDGALGIVAAHDLRLAVAGSLRDDADTVVHLDLSRVVAVDGDGIAALHWCRDHAVATGRRLMWSGCSEPVRRALRATSRPDHQQLRVERVG